MFQIRICVHYVKLHCMLTPSTKLGQDVELMYESNPLPSQWYMCP